MASKRPISAEYEFEQWVLSELHKIAVDPKETPARRKKAREALMIPLRSELQAIPVAVWTSESHTHGGGMFMHTQAVEEGWDGGPREWF